MVLSLWCVVLVATAETNKAPEAAARDRQMITKAMAYLDADGAKLEKSAACVNCHHAPLRRWALREAEKAGLAIDTQALGESTDKDIKKLLGVRDDYKGREWAHSLSSFYVLASLDDKDLSLPAETADALAKILIADQSADGSWKAAQQFGNQRRPKKDANEVQTMWSLLALSKLEPREGAKAARETGLAWLKTAEQGTTIDARALRLVVERRWRTPDKAAEFQATLLELQHDDGGWGWQDQDPSDAWGTGLALFALSTSTDKAARPNIDQALAFLAKTQKENGSWHVEGKLTKNADMASYFGTVWTIIGVSRTMARP